MRVRCPSCGEPLSRLPYPPSTVDAIIEFPGNRIVLVKRRFEPMGWALPGGFLDEGETLEEACRREVREETGLAIDELRQMHTYSDPQRDPRHHTVTTVFVARASGTLVAGDDAAEAAFFSLEALPRPLCFDHDLVIRDYRSGRWGVGPNGDQTE